MATNSYHHGDLKNALIHAGIEILAEEGVPGLSLRKVARQAGVSHAAPYAHFSDKRALIAAIATEGHNRINALIARIIATHEDDPLAQLVDTAFAYLQFGIDEPDLFQLTFAGIVEQEKDYPALVEMTGKNFEQIRQIVMRCQQADIFASGSDELLALNVWGSVHGLVSLLLQGQISSSILNRFTPRQLVLFTLDQITQVTIKIR